MEQIELIDYFKSDKTFTLKEVLKQHWKQDSYSYENSPRSWHGLMLVLHGNVKFSFDKEEITANAGDVIFLPENSHYKAIFEDEADDYLVNFKSESNNLKMSIPTVLFKNAPLECNKSFAVLIEESFYSDLTSPKLTGFFYILLDNILNTMLLNSELKSETVENAKRILGENYRLGIDEISTLCGVSESSLRKKFKAETGFSPGEYRLNLKLNRAKYLLEATDMSINEISDELDFFDAAAFCRLFKKHIGITPKQFSKNKQL